MREAKPEEIAEFYRRLPDESFTDDKGRTFRITVTGSDWSAVPAES